MTAAGTLTLLLLWLLLSPSLPGLYCRPLQLWLALERVPLAAISLSTSHSALMLLCFKIIACRTPLPAASAVVCTGHCAISSNLAERITRRPDVAVLSSWLPAGHDCRPLQPRPALERVPSAAT
jgi:hypothetical protein